MEAGEEEVWGFLGFLIFKQSCLPNSITYKVGIQTLKKWNFKKKNRKKGVGVGSGNVRITFGNSLNFGLWRAKLWKFTVLTEWRTGNSYKLHVPQVPNDYFLFLVEEQIFCILCHCQGSHIQTITFNLINILVIL